MATSELIAPLPRLTLSNGMTIAFEAIDPATGLAVSGVKVSQVAIYGETEDAEPVTETQLGAGPFMLVPGPQA